ncbi:DUF2017 family protein [Microbacterium sp. NPDC019599]|uniref:DUF2017 family protein n=1 Tax=Microbacterium sp. NPDC019599 TaxID=3154690 RepID=UPI0033D159EC
MTERLVVLEMAHVEARHLARLVEQFAELLAETAEAGEATPDDPAVARLVPDAYADDPDASREFRSLTQRELLDRRSTDAATVLATLHSAADPALADDEHTLTRMSIVELDPEALYAWLRTLAALRLVLASRLGIQDEDDHDDQDPRFGIYDWLGYRLDGLVKAAEGA